MTIFPRDPQSNSTQNNNHYCTWNCNKPIHRQHEPIPRPQYVIQNIHRFTLFVRSGGTMFACSFCVPLRRTCNVVFSAAFAFRNVAKQMFIDIPCTQNGHVPLYIRIIYYTILRILNEDCENNIDVHITISSKQKVTELVRLLFIIRPSLLIKRIFLQTFWYHWKAGNKIVIIVFIFSQVRSKASCWHRAQARTFRSAAFAFANRFV